MLKHLSKKEKRALGASKRGEFLEKGLKKDKPQSKKGQNEKRDYARKNQSPLPKRHGH